MSSVPTLTAVGHANLGTGAEPQTHGLAVNYLFNRVTGKSQEAYDALDPGEMLALTLADVWNIETEGQAVIVGQGGAIRATAGLVGHGACVVNGRRVRAASYSTAGDGAFETNPKCYTLSDALKPLTRAALLDRGRRHMDGPRHRRPVEVPPLGAVPALRRATRSPPSSRPSPSAPTTSRISCWST